MSLEEKGRIAALRMSRELRMVEGVSRELRMNGEVNRIHCDNLNLNFDYIFVRNTYISDEREHRNGLRFLRFIPFLQKLSLLNEGVHSQIYRR